MFTDTDHPNLLDDLKTVHEKVGYHKALRDLLEWVDTETESVGLDEVSMVRLLNWVRGRFQ